MRVRTIDIEGLHVVLCLKFDHRAPARDVDEFKQSLIQCDDVTHSLEATGTFDFMAELGMPDFQSYTNKMKELAEPMARLVERFETSFIGRRFIPQVELEDDLWVPCREGLQRIRCRDIDLVRAEGDYVRIHSGSNHWLINMTMSAMLTRLDGGLFLQLHRSAIVRKDFIDRLMHRDGRWEARLSDGTAQRVAKSHVVHTLRVLRGIPPTNEGGSRLDRHPDERRAQLADSVVSAGSPNGKAQLLS